MATRSERAEAVRKLVREARHGLLSTTGLEPAGIPYGSLVPVASNEDGLPLLLVSHLAQTGTYFSSSEPRPLVRASTFPSSAPRRPAAPPGRCASGRRPEDWPPG